MPGAVRKCSVCHEDLPDLFPVYAERFSPGSHQQALSDSSAGLLHCHIFLDAIKSQFSRAGPDGAGADHYALNAFRLQLHNLPGHIFQICRINAAVFSAQRVGAYLDNYPLNVQISHSNFL